MRAIYERADAAFSAFSCPGTAECCQLLKTGLEPWLWPSEWLTLEAWLVRERRPRPLPPRQDLGCPLLDAEGMRCTVYGARPLGCRTYFCHRIRGPARQPTEVMNGLQRRLEVLHEGEPKPLLTWLRETGWT
ncbi:MAG TPA: YkgJ family cysteine cluster protein [Myxococcaceae bacterium]|nr:YkgJ family cysteine cluster protein [Myxococcaceae bacterium]